jgi:predicted aspartyl protease
MKTAKKIQPEFNLIGLVKDSVEHLTAEDGRVQAIVDSKMTGVYWVTLYISGQQVASDWTTNKRDAKRLAREFMRAGSNIKAPTT